MCACALNAAGQSRVTLSPRCAQLRAVRGPRHEEKERYIRAKRCSLAVDLTPPPSCTGGRLRRSESQLVRKVLRAARRFQPHGQGRGFLVRAARDLRDRMAPARVQPVAHDKRQLQARPRLRGPVRHYHDLGSFSSTLSKLQCYIRHVKPATRNSHCRAPLRLPLPPSPRVFNTPVSAAQGSRRCSPPTTSWPRTRGRGRGTTLTPS